MGTELAEDMNGQVSEYPGEDPTELEHKKAMEYLERALRSKDLLSYAVASPAKTAEYADNPGLTEPVWMIHRDPLQKKLLRDD